MYKELLGIHICCCWLLKLTTLLEDCMTKCVSNSYQSTWGFLYHISFSNIWNLLTLKLANFWHSAISDSVDHHCSSQQVWPQSQHVFKAEILSFILILHKLNRRQFVHTEAFHTMRRALHVLSAVMSLGQCECCKCIAFNSLLSQKLPQVAYQPLTVRQNVVITKLHYESPCKINTDKSDKRNSH